MEISAESVARHVTRFIDSIRSEGGEPFAQRNAILALEYLREAYKAGVIDHAMYDVHLGRIEQALSDWLLWFDAGGEWADAYAMPSNA
jgi:type IV secretory pathway TrbF-like protein